MRTITSLFFASLLVSLAILPACSKDVTGSCERIAEACHDLDTGEGAAHECHEFAEGEGVTDEQCADREDDCVASCTGQE